MNTEENLPAPLTKAAPNAFWRGVLLRLLYGTPGLPVLALVAPSFFGEERRKLVMALGLYLAICVAGGAHDAGAGIGRTIRKRDWLHCGISLICLVIILWVRR